VTVDEAENPNFTISREKIHGSKWLSRFLSLSHIRVDFSVVSLASLYYLLFKSLNSLPASHLSRARTRYFVSEDGVSCIMGIERGDRYNCLVRCVRRFGYRRHDASNLVKTIEANNAGSQ
jgi:hypothetical protein